MYYKESGIRNLCIENGYIESSYPVDRIGMLVGEAWEYSNIEDCRVSGGKIVINNQNEKQWTGRVGGIAGIMAGKKISRCLNTASIQCVYTNYAGGIVGEAVRGALIDECCNYGDITGSYVSQCGGIVGSHKERGNRDSKLL